MKKKERAFLTEDSDFSKFLILINVKRGVLCCGLGNSLVLQGRASLRGITLGRVKQMWQLPYRVAAVKKPSQHTCQQICQKNTS